MKKNVFTETESQEWLLSVLRTSVIGVEFVKADGTNRIMSCTLDTSLIPQDALPKNSGRKASTESCAVFDIEKGEWRSFRWDSVVAVNIS